MSKVINFIIIIGLTLFFCSCYSTLRTGRYIIEDARGYTVTFKGVQGDWRVPTDTLKTGDTIFLQRVKRESKANVW